nr:cation-transporting P-type ATPase [Dehalococcoidia bacterium]
MSKRELGSEDSHRQAAPEGLPDPRSLAPKLAGLSPADRFRRLDSTPSGLSSGEVRARRERDGWNDPVAPAARHRLVPLLRNFTHTLALLLWFAAGLALAARIYELAFAVVAVIAVNGVFAAAQEYRAEQVVEGLMRRVAVRSRVLRDGTWQVLPARDLVRGDVVALEKDIRAAAAKVGVQAEFTGEAEQAPPSSGGGELIGLAACTHERHLTVDE